MSGPPLVFRVAFRGTGTLQHEHPDSTADEKSIVDIATTPESRNLPVFMPLFYYITEPRKQVGLGISFPGRDRFRDLVTHRHLCPAQGRQWEW